MRKLITGEQVPEADHEISLTQIKSKCPRKWAFIDLETGSVYGCDENGKGWVLIPKKANALLKKTLKVKV